MAGRKVRVVIEGDSRSVERAFGRTGAAAQGLEGQLRSAGRSISSAGKRLSLYVTAPIVAAGVASFKMADQFETSMSRVIGLAGQSEKAVGKWSQQLLKLGPEIGKGPRELAEALYFVASSGVPAAKVLDVVRVSGKAAAAGLGETAVVADAVTSVMNAYGPKIMSAARATDVLVATVREGKGEASEFAPIIGNVVAFAAKLKVGFEEVGAALAAMTQLGTSPDTAATQLQAFFSSLLKVTPKAEKALGSVGLSFATLQRTLSTQGLLATLTKIRDAFGGNTAAMAQAFPNIRALRGLFGLLDEDGNRVEGVFKRMGDSSGSLAKAFEESTERSGFSMEQFRASVEALGIVLGTIMAPVVAEIAKWATELAIRFQNLDGGTQRIIIVAAALAATLGPVLIIVGSLVTAVAALLPVFAVLVSPIGLVVVAIAALAGAIALAVIWPDKFRAVLQRFGVSTEDARAYTEALQRAFAMIKTVVQAVFPVIEGILRGFLKVVVGVVNVIAGILTGDWARVWQGVKQIVSGAISAMVGMFVRLPATLLGLALQAGLAILRGIGQGLARLGPAIQEKMAQIPSALAAVAAAAPGWAAGIGRAIVSGILSGVGGLFGALKSKLEGTLKSVLSSLNPFSPVEHGGAKYIGQPLADGAIRGWIEGSAALPDKMSETLTKAVERARDVIASKRSMFASAFDELSNTALSAFDRIAGEIETRAEKKLRQMEEARSKSERDARERAARAELDAANQAIAGLAPGEGESESDFAARKEEALARALEAQKALDDALYEQRRANLERQAEQERKNLDDRLALRRRKFQEDLEALAVYAEQHHLKAEELNKRIIKLFGKYNIPWRNAAVKLGLNLAEGLTSAMDSARNAARALAQAVIDQLSNIKVVVQVDVRGSGEADKRPGRAAGGPVIAGSAYVVGERGPELFVPSDSGRIVPSTTSARAMGVGGTTIQLHFNGPAIGSSREFEDLVRRALYDVSRRNPGVGLSVS